MATPPGRKVGGRDAALQCTAGLVLQQQNCYNTRLLHCVVQLRATTAAACYISAAAATERLQVERCFNLVECRRTVVGPRDSQRPSLYHGQTHPRQLCFRSGSWNCEASHFNGTFLHVLNLPCPFPWNTISEEESMSSQKDLQELQLSNPPPATRFKL